WPSSQAIRNLRPLMVTVTRDRSPWGGGLCRSAVMGVQHGTDRADGGVEPPCNVPVGGLEHTRPRHHGVEVARPARAVVVKGMDRRHEIILAEIDLAPLFRRRLEPIEGKRQPPGSRFNRTGIRHRRYPRSRYEQDESSVRRRKTSATAIG